MTLRELARQCGAERDEPGTVLRKMQDRIRSDRKLFDELRLELVVAGCQSVIYSLRHAISKEIRTTPPVLSMKIVEPAASDALIQKSVLPKAYIPPKQNAPWSANPHAQGAASRASERALTKSLLDMSLSIPGMDSNVLLRNAPRPLIIKAAEYSLQCGKSHIHKARFFSAVAARLDDDDQTGLEAVKDDAGAWELWQQTEPEEEQLKAVG
jgi:hypothetical protein